uniref:Ferric reduction oxidase 8 n=1 Tax=Rhizophora mucronata TaxID=61149 RepID=A0A2P2K0N1_RHIMU
MVLATMTALSAIVFLVCLMGLNHFFAPNGKKVAASEQKAVSFEKKVSKEKTPSSVDDLLLLCSFIISMLSSTFLVIILRWKKLKEEIPPVSQKQRNANQLSSVETRSPIEEHDIYFGERPNFQDVFSKLPIETGGLDIGVLVCGPETMKESVASICQLKNQGLNMGAKGKKPYFYFHSLNFTL